MGFRFSKRIPVSKGTGINVSKSGLSVSHRSKYGAFGTKGFSIRTGIAGLSFRQSWSGFGKGGGLETLLALLLFAIFVFVAYNLLLLIGLLIYNTFALVWDFLRFIYRYTRIKALEHKLERDRAEFAGDPKRGFVTFSLESTYKTLTDIRYYLEEILLEDGEHGVVGQDMCIIRFVSPSFPDNIAEQKSPLRLKNNGVVTWYKIVGQELVFGEDFVSVRLD
jgi:hypothetical protein